MNLPPYSELTRAELLAALDELEAEAVELRGEVEELKERVDELTGRTTDEKEAAK